MGSNLIEFISTGKVRMREPMSGQPITNKSTTLRLLRCFTGEWTPWLPIGVFLIRHADGPILIDTGASPQCMQAGYFPMLSYLTNVLSELQLAPEDGIVSQLAKLGVKPTDLQAVVLTHLHHDHAGGLEEIVEAAPEVPVYISASHWEAFGKHPTYAAVQGCASNHWPKDFNLRLLNFDGKPVGPWTQSDSITKDGQVIAVETPGHVPGHISVIVKDGSGGPGTPDTYFITGDATYSLELLEREEPDGINQDPMTAFESLQLIKKFSEQQKVVVLPSHDVNTSIILDEKRQYRAKQ
ncbi:N-acyl homoserine lactonase [Colletotrichum sp. SAR 10_99]|nr:N-acyl homoserine lactonase [Colletotrichum sp. SAR 10_96]KAJ5017461.1 N-acyl homoserine lactonase [Colletotrichum sp. SAR 10_99]